MDLQELEAEYKKRLELIEKSFIESIKNKKNGDADYRRDVKKVREWYSAQIKYILQNSKKIKLKNNPKKEQYKTFKLEKTDIELSKIKRIKANVSLWYFKKSIKIKNFFDSLYYPMPAYYIKKIRCNIANSYKIVKIRAIRIKKIIMNKIGSLFEKVKVAFSKAYHIPLDLIKSIFKKKKEEEKKSV